MSRYEERVTFPVSLKKRGLFVPFLERMAKGTRSMIIEEFLKNRFHFSQSGFTARIVTDWLMENEVEFHVIWRPKLGYEVRPTGEGNARLDHAVGSISEVLREEGPPAREAARHAAEPRSARVPGLPRDLRGPHGVQHHAGRAPGARI